MGSSRAHSPLKRPLAVSAVLASTAAVTLGGGLARAHATAPGAANSPLTISDGTAVLTVGGVPTTFPTTVTDASWAPDGSRVAYVDGSGAVVTARPDGSGIVVVAPAKAGAVRSAPTWIEGGAFIVYAESVGSGPSALQAAPANPDGGDGIVVATRLPAGTSAGAQTAPDGNGDVFTFQRRNPATNSDEVWIQNSHLGDALGDATFIAAGSDPALSPDGTKIAFVRPDAQGTAQIWTVAWNSAAKSVGVPVQITSGPVRHTRPAWSPDGTRIADETSDHATAQPIAVESVAADGSGPRQESGKPGTPSYEPLNKDHVVRLAGNDRIATAVAVSQKSWPSASSPAAGHATAVVLSRDDQFADALGGGSFAAYRGPLLLTPTARLDAAVTAEIVRVLGPADVQHPQTVYLLGGEHALSPVVAKQISALGYLVNRLGGADRYATAVRIAQEDLWTVGSSHPVPNLLVATGNEFPDALSAAAASPGAMILLTDGKTMPKATADMIAGLYHAGSPVPFRAVGIGGPANAALAAAGIAHTAITGSDRYQTSYLVARSFFNGAGFARGRFSGNVGFATALTWPDALSGGASMAHVQGPLLLVDPKNGPSADEAAWLSGWSPSVSTATVFGGTSAVSDPVATGLAGLISGPGGYDTLLNPRTP